MNFKVFHIFCEDKKCVDDFANIDLINRLNALVFTSSRVLLNFLEIV